MFQRDMSDASKRKKAYEYDPEVISDRIDKARAAAELPVKAFAEAVWPHLGENARFTYYKKRAGESSSWELPEIERVCVILDAPLGWPFVSWSYARKLEKGE
jgi:hypothetical protein